MNLADNINIDGGADSWEPMVLSRQFAIYDPRMRRGDDSCKAFPWAEYRTREQCRKISATRKTLAGCNFSATAPHMKLLCVLCGFVRSLSTQSIISGRSVAILCDGKFFVIR